jgi:pyrroline-5-carboxylate reductase
MNGAATIALIGCGKMGGAMLRGWIDARTAGHIDVLEPHGLPLSLSALTPEPVTVHGSAAIFLRNANKHPDVVVLAVKPQIMDEVCAAIAPGIPKQALVLSIAAGKPVAAYERAFGADQPVVRVMPNTPAAIGKGMSVAVANAHVSAEQRALAHELLSAVGKVEWVRDETMMDAVTALSGSGPAYIFLLIETLAKAGEKAGLPPDMAMTLARQTVIGSAALAESDAQTPAATLRENVTSPGGTTAAALEVLMNGELQDIYNRAISAAVKRGQELAV